jgi:nucleotide-binding universal stress UspA family protein
MCWLNRTLRTWTDPRALAEVAADEAVAVVDLPRRLMPDAAPNLGAVGVPAYRAEYEEHEKEAQQLLEAEVERVKEAGATVAQAHLRMGRANARADEEIVELAQSLEAGMIVMGSRGHGGVRRALMGSVSESVVRHDHCPVLVVRKEKR